MYTTFQGAECAFGGLLSNKRMECGCFENSPMALPVHVINCHCRWANSQLLFTVILNYIPVRFGNAKICCCSVAMFCLTLCDPVDRSTPGFPVLHYLTCSDSCLLSQWCHPTISSSAPPFSCPQCFPASGPFPINQLIFIRWPKYWSFSISPSNEHSGLISSRIDQLDLLEVQGTLVFSSTTTLTSTHDYWKNHSFDYNVLRWVSTSYFNYSLYNDNHQETKAALLAFRLVSLAVCFHSPRAACLAPRTELRMVVTGPLRGWWPPEASPGPFIHSWIKPGRFLSNFAPQSPPH